MSRYGEGRYRSASSGRYEAARMVDERSQADDFEKAERMEAEILRMGQRQIAYVIGKSTMFTDARRAMREPEQELGQYELETLGYIVGTHRAARESVSNDLVELRAGRGQLTFEDLSERLDNLVDDWIKSCSQLEELAGNRAGRRNLSLEELKKSMDNIANESVDLCSRLNELERSRVERGKITSDEIREELDNVRRLYYTPRRLRSFFNGRSSPYGDSRKASPPKFGDVSGPPKAEWWNGSRPTPMENDEATTSSFMVPGHSNARVSTSDDRGENGVRRRYVDAPPSAGHMGPPRFDFNNRGEDNPYWDNYMGPPLPGNRAFEYQMPVPRNGPFLRPPPEKPNPRSNPIMRLPPDNRAPREGDIGNQGANVFTGSSELPFRPHYADPRPFSLPQDHEYPMRGRSPNTTLPGERAAGNAVPVFDNRDVGEAARHLPNQNQYGGRVTPKPVFNARETNLLKEQSLVLPILTPSQPNARNSLPINISGWPLSPVDVSGWSSDEWPPESNPPTYTRMSRKYVSIESLRNYYLDFEIESDPGFVLIKRWIPKPLQEELWNHTRNIRLQRQAMVSTPGSSSQSIHTGIPTGVVLTRMSRKHLSLETLRSFGIHYLLDQDPKFVMINRWVPPDEQQKLWSHTKTLREARKQRSFSVPQSLSTQTHNATASEIKFAPYIGQVDMENLSSEEDSDSVLYLSESESEYETLIPCEKTNEEALVELGFPYETENGFFIVPRALRPDHLLEIDKRSEAINAIAQALAGLGYPFSLLKDGTFAIQQVLNLAQIDEIVIRSSKISEAAPAHNHTKEIRENFLTAAYSNTNPNTQTLITLTSIMLRMDKIRKSQSLLMVLPPGPSLTEQDIQPAKNISAPKSLHAADNPIDKNITTLIDQVMPTKDLSSPPGTPQVIGSVAVVKRKSKVHRDWFQQMKSFETFIDASRKEPDDAHPRIKIAILDTGLDLSHPDIRQAQVEGRLHIYDFIENAETIKDESGHGTHCTSLLLKYAPNAEVFVGRVFQTDEAGDDSCDILTKAIIHASEVWKVNIISLSLGFTRENTPLEKAIRKASFSALIFACAANNTNNETIPIRFPARMPEVICIFSSDSFGRPSLLFNPNWGTHKPNFMLPGEKIEGAWPASLASNDEEAFEKESKRSRKSKSKGKSRNKDEEVEEKGWYKYQTGTSVSTPIAAAVAAGILEFCRQDLELNQHGESDLWDALNHHGKMTRLWKKLMVDEYVVGYAYVKPWMSMSLEILATRTKRDIKMLMSEAIKGA